MMAQASEISVNLTVNHMEAISDGPSLKSVSAISDGAGIR